MVPKSHYLTKTNIIGGKTNIILNAKTCYVIYTHQFFTIKHPCVQFSAPPALRQLNTAPGAGAGEQEVWLSIKLQYMIEAESVTEQLESGT